MVQSHPVYKTKKWTSLSSSLALDIQKSLDMSAVPSDPILPADQYRKLLDAFSTTYITTTSPTYQRLFSESPWFDKECKALRRRIRKMVRIIKSSNDPQTRAKLIDIKRTYRNMIHCKKQQYIFEAWSTLRSAVERHDSRSFWRLVRPSAPFNPATQISADEWIAYYSTSFASPNHLTDLLQSPLDLSSCSLSPTSSINFTSTRIFNIIMSMQRNKAPGPDMVPLDLLLTDPLWWSEHLTPVFTAISSALDIPDSWREAIIVLIFKGHPVASLFYADDAVILSRTAADLANAVNAFTAYCKAEALNINDKQSKFLLFTRSRKLQLEPLKIIGGYLEKVKAFKYLGLIFTYNLSWTTHLQSAFLAATTTSNAIVRFYHQKGGKHLPAAIQIFNAKVVPKLLYGCEVWTTAIS
ncbi:Hypothetical predicted protein, partial [Podarcis lilfordi]